MKHLFVVLFILSVLYCKSSAVRLGNPYHILGVSRDASPAEIKKAYKLLAKEWHPDKNKEEKAEEMFIKVIEAYKILSDSSRRHLFDTTGQTEDKPNFRRKSSDINRAESFGWSGTNFKFNFNSGDGTAFYNQYRTNMESYKSLITSRSKKQPYLILFYSDWCIACSHIEPIWKKLIEELQPINFGIATVHAGQEAELARKIGVKTVPYLVMLLDGHPYHYVEASLSITSSLDFIRGKFSPKLVQRIDSSNVDEFLGGWMDNRVRVLIFGRLDIIRLRYLTVAWEFRDRAAIGYCEIGHQSTEDVVFRYSVSNKVDTLLIFNEDSSTPIATVAMGDLPYATMKDIIQSHQYLLLPRLSSQAVFDGLCPVSPSRGHKHFCAVLFTENTARDDKVRTALREYVSIHKPAKRNEHHEGVNHNHQVNYAYIFQEKQTHFVNALVGGSMSLSEIHKHLVILWRTDQRRIKFTWVEESFGADEEGEETGGTNLRRSKYNSSSEALTNTVNKLLNNDLPLPYETEVQDLFDEHANGILWRILTRLSHWQESVWQTVSTDDVYMVMSMLVTISVIVAVGFLMHYKVKKEEEYLLSQGIDLNPLSSSASRTPQLSIHELRGESYNGMVRLLKPGCRTIVLLCNSKSKPKLITKFYKCCWPYRRNKTLMFGFLNIERQSAMEWYKRILLLGLSQPRELNINPKNAIGTVVALNGHRKYYCLFHAKHPEDRRKKSLTSTDSDTDTSTSDIECGDSKADAIGTDKPLLNYHSSVLFEEQLLEGLSNWLDRLFEGTTHRYPINYWPDWPGK